MLISLCPEVFYVKMINTQLAAQFITHMSVSFYTGFLLASPYVIYQLFRFVSPALYENEKKYSTRIVGWGYFLFMMGVLLNYFLIFPLTFRFLATYQVSMEVENTITLSSYMDTLMMMSLMMGIVFEIPVLCWLFAKLGFLTADFMKRYRRYYSDSWSCYHSYVRCLYIDDGVCAYVFALRSQHLDCKSDWEETAGRIRRGSA